MARDVGRRMGLPVIDSVIPAAVAAGLKVPVPVARAHDERVAGRLERLLRGGAFLSAAGFPGGHCLPLAAEMLLDEAAFHREAEAVIRRVAAGPGAVVVGRAAAFVLGRGRQTFHVRLDAPFQSRAIRTARERGIGLDLAQRLQRGHDAQQATFVRRRHGADIADHRYYDLVLDPTGCDGGLCAAAIAAAAEAHFHHRLPASG